MDDPLKEEMLPEVVEAKPLQPVRYMEQCKVCNSLTCQIVWIREGVTWSELITCSKGHFKLIRNVPKDTEVSIEESEAKSLGITKE